MPSNRALPLALVVLLPLSGCGGSSQVETVSVSGTVTYGGQGVEGALVSFFPKGGGRVARGTTSADGKFVLTTYDDGDGAGIGEYEVTVVKETTVEGNTPEDLAKQAAGALPGKYGSTETSGLTVKIEEATDAIEFVLE